MVDASNLKLNAELNEVDARINIVYAYYCYRSIEEQVLCGVPNINYEQEDYQENI